MLTVDCDPCKSIRNCQQRHWIFTRIVHNLTDRYDLTCSCQYKRQHDCMATRYSTVKTLRPWSISTGVSEMMVDFACKLNQVTIYPPLGLITKSPQNICLYDTSQLFIIIYYNLLPFIIKLSCDYYGLRLVCLLCYIYDICLQLTISTDWIILSAFCD